MHGEGINRENRALLSSCTVDAGLDIERASAVLGLGCRPNPHTPS